jgi:hypothetical protein
MSAICRLLGAGLLALGVSAPVVAQGLGGTAAREKAKRTGGSAKKEPAKVFTNDDLEAGRPPGSKPSSDDSASATPAPSEPDGLPAQAPGEDRLAEERPFLDAFNAANSEVSRIQRVIKDLSDKLNPMSMSYIFGAGGSNDPNEELRVRAELTEAERQLASARQEVAAAAKRLENVRLGRPVTRE